MKHEGLNRSKHILSVKWTGKRKVSQEQEARQSIPGLLSQPSESVSYSYLAYPCSHLDRDLVSAGLVPPGGSLGADDYTFSHP